MLPDEAGGVFVMLSPDVADEAPKRTSSSASAQPISDERSLASANGYAPQSIVVDL